MLALLLLRERRFSIEMHIVKRESGLEREPGLRRQKGERERRSTKSSFLFGQDKLLERPSSLAYQSWSPRIVSEKLCSLCLHALSVTLNGR